MSVRARVENGKYCPSTPLRVTQHKNYENKTLGKRKPACRQGRQDR